MSYIYSQAEYLAKKYQTRNPYELLDAIGATLRLSYEYEKDGLKGFSTILNRRMYAVVNGKLSNEDRRIVAGHETAHLILHKREILSSPACALKDFNLYDNTGKLEFEANSFLADFLISDKQVIDTVADPDKDYFNISKELYIPPPLFAFKLLSMIRRGHNLKNPAVLQSDFLGKAEIWQS